MPDTLELARLTPNQIDDQAISEINAILSADQGHALPRSALLRMAAYGPLLVARRPCGALPEIVGVAGLAPQAQGDLLEIVAVDIELGGTSLACDLLAGLRAEALGPSLFRPRDRPPLGWAADRQIH